MISLSGLFLTGIDVFSGLAFGTIMVVGVAVLGSLTFLPALLSLLGKATDRGRIPVHRPGGGRRRAVPAVGSCRPRRGAPTAGARRARDRGVLVLAAPLLSLHLEDSGIHCAPR